MPSSARLPEFRKPPLNETVLGVQFAPPRGYQQIRAGEVWALFRKDFPDVQEHPPVPPVFETFGSPQGQQINFGFVTGASHDRFWFLTPSGEQLIQFQNDRFLHNWRQVPGSTSEYPRFPKLIKNFENELHKLENYFAKLETQNISINQCELSYINHIYLSDNSEFRPGEWLGFINFTNLGVEDFATNFRRTIYAKDGRPLYRVVCEAATAISPAGRRFIVLTLTARGAPEGVSISAALEFLTKTRETLVNLFAEVTTEAAHKAWERQR